MLHAGIAIKHPEHLPGTLGALIIDTTSHKVGLLSNWHVLAGSNAQRGDNIYSTRQTSRPIATLGPHFCDHVGDAAVAWLLPGTEYSPELAGTQTTFTGVAEPRKGQILAKVGAVSGYTRARVASVGPTTVSFHHGPQTFLGFTLEPIDDSRQAQTISRSGDSGSVWFDENNGDAVGLHIGGQANPFRGPVYAKACLLGPVLEALSVRLLTGSLKRPHHPLEPTFAECSHTHN